jgi:bifunctional UDP-N-acetylglucosamine pyrophosphorylase / glucosamine-1-phosphate N-acetyltransferase
LGGMYAAELPDPIPNSEVKRGRADDSLVHASAKVGSCPFMGKPSERRVFSCLKNWCIISIMSRQIVILAAGKGTRMASPIPKVLIPLRGKPVIKYLLEEVREIPQDTNPVIVVGFMNELVKKELGEDFLYALQTEQLGTGHAVLSARPQISAENFIVLYGDMPFVTAESLQKLIKVHEQGNSKLSMFTGIVPNFEGVYDHFKTFGRIIRDEQKHILRIQEYSDCTDEQKTITEVNPGIYMFNSEWLWPHLEKVGSGNAQGEIYLTDIIEVAINDGQKIESLPIAPEEIYGINTPDHLAHAQTLID